MELFRPLNERPRSAPTATVLCSILLVLALVLGAAPVGAHHAEPVRTEPEDGATLARPPTQVRVWFNQPVQMPGSGLAVTDASGNRVDVGGSRWGDVDGMELVVDLDAIGPGTYKVIWRTSEIGEDYNEGYFTFGVAADATDQGTYVQLAAALGLATIAMLGVVLVRRGR